MQILNIFTSFSPKFFLAIFLGKSKLNFWTTNEDFEQCAQESFFEKLSIPDDTEEGEMASALLGGVGVLVKTPPAEADVFGCIVGILLLI